jgi:hypothetical protein
MPLGDKIQGVRTEKAKVVETPDGSQPPYHRVFEFWFDDQQHMQRVLSSPEAQSVRNGFVTSCSLVNCSSCSTTASRSG